MNTEIATTAKAGVGWHDYFTYDAETGNLIWKERPRNLFPSTKAFNMFHTRNVGKIAGCRPSQRGVRAHASIVVNQRHYNYHRVVWEMMVGLIPKGFSIDHIDGDPWNNRLSNLRVASHAENMRNAFRRKRTIHGLQGVTMNVKTGKWIARMRIHGKGIRLGVFDTKGMAAVAYAKAAMQHHGQYARITPTHKPFIFTKP